MIIYSEKKEKREFSLIWEKYIIMKKDRGEGTYIFWGGEYIPLMTAES